jgi:hypothetical protein
MPNASTVIPPGLVELPQRHRLPDLGATDFILRTGRRALVGPAAALSSAILTAGDTIRVPAPAGPA